MEFIFPDVGEGISEGKLVRWLVKEGDAIKADQEVAEVETDKAVVEIPAPVAGIVGKLIHQEGDIVEVGKTLMTIEQEVVSKPAAPAAAASPETSTGPPAQQAQSVPTQTSSSSSAASSSAPPAQVPVVASRHSDDILAVPRVRILARKQGIDLGAVQGTGVFGNIRLADLQGQAGSPALNAAGQPVAAASPAVAHVAVAPGERPLSGAPSSAQPLAASHPEVLASPSTRRLARELKVDIGMVKGTGEHGMVTKTDIRDAAKGGIASAVQPTVQATASADMSARSISAPVRSPSSADLYIPMSATRAAIARKMTESSHAAALVTHMDEADVTDLVALREKEKERLAQQGIKLTYLPFFVKAVVVALQQHPYFNAMLDEPNQRIVLHKQYHVGIAVDTEEGLIVPVVRNADRLSILEVAAAIQDLSGRARTHKLRLDEMQGSTFSISSIGSVGGTHFTPLTNYPEVSILGIGSIRDRPAVRDGAVVVRKMVPLSLTYDHRVLDGAQAARFMNTIVELMQDPGLLLMELT
ncbi:hypothetical protein AUJ68_03265 [Candidatus Woesearchaeota archaeon CG1_02_57_44]|nr:MAG: hypothetical protein AUJ68_03265 [Candidatus Woesearchaeota archaeon CG1_02_57_44]